MTIFQAPKSDIHLLARGLLVYGREIIICRVKGANWFFLPGGHVESGESIGAALVRELREEIGDGDYKLTNFMGVCENIFALDEGILQHEINIILEVNIPTVMKINTKEDHIEFVNISAIDLKNYKILPTTLKDGVLEWLKNGKPFFKQI